MYNKITDLLKGYSKLGLVGDRGMRGGGWVGFEIPSTRDPEHRLIRSPYPQQFVF